MKYNNRSGFTLLEIIIVIIIIGVLASLALPRFFSTVEFSRSTEAMNSMAVIRKSIERCSVFDNTYNDCTAFNNIDVDDPGTNPDAHFTYALLGGGVSASKAYTITATRTTLNGGSPSSSVALLITTAGVTRAGTSAFASIR